jgi:hypothetical protein
MIIFIDFKLVNKITTFCFNLKIYYIKIFMI